MTRTYGKNWIPGFVRRHPRPGSSEEHLGDLGFLIWVLTKDKRVFGPKVLPERARDLAHRVREARNLSSHQQLNDLDPKTARAALQSMSEFLRVLGEPGKANEVRQLTGRLRPVGHTPSQVAQPAPKTKTKPKPKPKPKKPQKSQAPKTPQQPQPKASGRPTIRIGCGAVAALAVVTWAVGWIFFGPHKASPYSGRYKNEPLGARLNTARLEVPRNYHLRFLDDPIAPLQGASGGDLGFSDEQVSATDGRIVVLTRGEKLGYTTCRDTTRYTATVPVTKNLRICVTTDTGVVAGVAVKGVRRQGTNSYLKLDIAVWKGHKPKG